MRANSGFLVRIGSAGGASGTKCHTPAGHRGTNEDESSTFNVQSSRFNDAKRRLRIAAVSSRVRAYRSMLNASAREGCFTPPPPFPPFRPATPIRRVRGHFTPSRLSHPPACRTPRPSAFAASVSSVLAHHHLPNTRSVYPAPLSPLPPLSRRSLGEGGRVPINISSFISHHSSFFLTTRGLRGIVWFVAAEFSRFARSRFDHERTRQTECDSRPPRG